MDMNNTNETTNHYEVEVDTAIAEATTTTERAYNALQFAKDELVRVQSRMANTEDIDLVARVISREEAKVAAKRAVLQHATAELASAEARYDGWSRFFLVTNTNGHIHSSVWCSTCFPDTAFAWLPELSGLTEADAVDEYGGILCSICFPSAPVEWTNGENKKDAAEKEAARLDRERNRLPEVKKANTKAELIRRKKYEIDRFETAIARTAEARHNGYEPGQQDAREAEQAEVELPKLRKQLARAEAQHAELYAAAEAAIESAGLR